MDLTIQQLKIIIDALGEYEAKYYDSRDDIWQGAVNNTISELCTEIDRLYNEL